MHPSAEAAVGGASRDPLVEDPHDAARAWIDLDAMTADEGGAYSAPLLRHGRVMRYDLAGRHRARVPRAFLRRRRRAPIWLRPEGSPWLPCRGRLQIRPHFAANRSIGLRKANGRHCQHDRNHSEMQSAQCKAPRHNAEAMRNNAPLRQWFRSRGGETSSRTAIGIRGHGPGLSKAEHAGPFDL